MGEAAQQEPASASSLAASTARALIPSLGRLSRQLRDARPTMKQLMQLTEAGLLGHIWPTTRIIAGLRTCKWLQQELLDQTEEVVLEMKDKSICPPAEAARSMRRFANHKTILRGRSIHAHEEPCSTKNRLLGTLCSETMLSFGSSVVHLEMSGLDLSTKEEVHQLAKLLRGMPNLTNLVLEGNNISEDSIAILEPSIHNLRRLKHLNLRRNRLKSGGLAKLQRVLRGSTMLEHLDVAHNSIGPRGAEAAFEDMTSSASSLSYIDVSHNHIGDAGAVKLSELVPRSKGLRHLDIGSNMIGKEGSQQLAKQLIHCPDLRHLNIDGLPVCDVELWAEVVCKLPSLQFLSLENTGLFDQSEWDCGTQTCVYKLQ